jgi:Ca2+-binding RTX toxin-like protein
MDDFATLPGGIYLGTNQGNHVDADSLFPPGVFDNLILTFGGRDGVKGGQGDDTILLGKGKDAADGGAGHDTMFGEQGHDLILDDAGNDVALGGDGHDTIALGAGNDVIGGNRGNDVLSGGDGDDVISGGDGHDTIFGGAGADTIHGDAGNDSLAGGEGADVYVFGSGFGKDVVLGFEKGVDTIAIEHGINGLAINSAADLVPYVGGNAAAATINLGGDTIRIVGLSKADLIANIGDYVKIV